MTDMPDYVEDFLEDVKATADAQSTVDRRTSDIRQFSKWLTNGGEIGDFEDYDAHDHYRMIHTHLRGLKNDDYSRNTISARYETLRQLYQFLTNHHRCFDATPFERTKRSQYLPQPDRETVESDRPYITKDQKETLCEHVGPPRFRNELMIRLMWQTGLRQGEVVDLKLENVNIEENRLEGVWRSKVRDTHTVSFGQSLTWWLDQWINGAQRKGYYHNDSEYVFITDRTPQFHACQPNKIIRKAADNAGIQTSKGVDKNGNERREITSHAVRRGHGMYLWQNGVDLHTIRRRLGHTSIEQTQDYLPITEEDTAEKIAGIEW